MSKAVFILEDPSRSRSVRDQELWDAKARAHRARAGHAQRKTRAHDPKLRPCSLYHGTELRALQYYRERTSIDWSGDYDRYLWTQLVNSAGATDIGLSYVQIALAYGQQCLEVNDERLKQISLDYGVKAIVRMNRINQHLDYAVALLHCLVVLQLSALISVPMFVRCLKLAAHFARQSQPDDHGLMDCLQRVLSQQCHWPSPRAALYDLPMERPALGPAVTSFINLRDARGRLEVILNDLAYQAWQSHAICWKLFDAWAVSFEKLRSHSNYLEWRVLKAACAVAVVQIKTLHSDRETDYDQYLDQYREVADVYEAVQQSRGESVQYRFNIDPGLLRLVVWSAFWCREPDLRSRLQALLSTWRRNEGCYSSATCGVLVGALQLLETDDLRPAPTSCTDVPEEKRVRLHAAALDATSGIIRLDYLRPPYNGPLESFYTAIRFDRCVHLSPEHEGVQQVEFCPQMIIGPAQFSFLESENPATYFTVRPKRFYFVLPGGMS
jgi:hypothetical protein